MGLKPGQLRSGLRNISTGRSAIPDSVIAQYDAKQLSLSDGDEVTSFPDSKNNFDLSGSGPIYRDSGINGNPSIEYNNGSEILSTSGDAFNLSNPVTCGFVFELSSDAGTNHYLGDGRDQRPLTRLKSSNGWEIFDVNDSNSVLGTNDTSINIIFARYSSDAVLREDGSQTASMTSSNGIDDFVLGNDDSKSNPWNGYIGAALIYDVALTDSEIADEENRLANKWGITL